MIILYPLLALIQTAVYMPLSGKFKIELFNPVSFFFFFLKILNFISVMMSVISFPRNEVGQVVIPWQLLRVLV